ncbi:DUF6913 domain-containing protein [Neotamlana laminarinivorans]|uniref:Uncharacterized protein n=1 Tax=Neotamlana laminarinivorans TaxID=2883124 RepID=A0A9X1HYV9_9FLAO|nr:hypothetical protein [Tamlana laminarinivorans]MCB4797478.1 hypothetical protein [Tamlana laminarinivorans]
MILQGFKEKSNKKYLNKLLSNRETNVTDDKVESLGIVVNVDEFDDIEQFVNFSETINIRSNKLKIITFSENEKEDLLSWDSCFNPADFGWNGSIKNTELDTLISKNFDLLISYYTKNITEIKLITALSKAKFKIGIYQEDERLNDLIIKTTVKEFNLFKDEVIKYLTILNKN